MADYKENLDYTASRIQELREKKGWNIQELGYRSDIDRPVMSKIEKGKKNITCRTLCKIAAAFEVRLSDLVK